MSPYDVSDISRERTGYADSRLAGVVQADVQFVSGSDDFQLRVYNISTGEKITSFEAHPDYIRCLTVHPTLSLVLTGSDDMTVKCWDWEKGWRCVQVSRLRGLTLQSAASFADGRSSRDTRITSWL